ncbi:hypothetical protein J6590_034807 [Homalodisca vitripennis]|nr:hypothetical protein J6590_034807 [Homalodisca vitripennis]
MTQRVIVLNKDVTFIYPLSRQHKDTSAEISYGKADGTRLRFLQNIMDLFKHKQTSESFVFRIVSFGTRCVTSYRATRYAISYRATRYAVVLLSEPSLCVCLATDQVAVTDRRLLSDRYHMHGGDSLGLPFPVPSRHHHTKTKTAVYRHHTPLTQRPSPAIGQNLTLLSPLGRHKH